jgi:ABC transporter substrate binding protein
VGLRVVSRCEVARRFIRLQVTRTLLDSRQPIQTEVPYAQDRARGHSHPQPRCCAARRDGASRQGSTDRLALIEDPDTKLILAKLARVGMDRGPEPRHRAPIRGRQPFEASGPAAELVRLRVEIIVAGDGAAIGPAREATKTLLIVMTVSGDPVAEGFVVSLGRPGGNITGLANISPDLAGKRLELLKESVPQFGRVAVLGPPHTRTGRRWKSRRRRWVCSYRP